ncbi:MAG: putative metallopeptidase [Candidatus Pacearchaeota archaeon]
MRRMRYEFAPEIQKITEDISKILFPHIRIDRIKCFRSYGTSSKNTIARCHSLGKLLQKALNTQPVYVLEFLSEKFDSLPKEDQIKIIIHELMHIPISFAGGFRHHDYVCYRNVEKNYKKYVEYKKRYSKNKEDSNA